MTKRQRPQMSHVCLLNCGSLEKRNLSIYNNDYILK